MGSTATAPAAMSLTQLNAFDLDLGGDDDGRGSPSSLELAYEATPAVERLVSAPWPRFDPKPGGGPGRVAVAMSGRAT